MKNKIYFNDVTVSIIHERNYPFIVRLLKMKLESENLDSLAYAINNVKCSDSSYDDNTVTFELDWLHMQCRHFRAWAVMKAYYGFTIEFRCGLTPDLKDGLYSIGGSETEEITSKTLLGLLYKLADLY